MYEIVCWDSEKGDWVVLERVETKEEAREAVRRLKDKCLSGDVRFVREGFRPLKNGLI